MVAIVLISFRFLSQRLKQTLIATLGIVIGTSIYIIMASLIYGFHKYLLKEMLNLNGQITITVKEKKGKENKRLYIKNWKGLIKFLSKREEVLGASPYLMGSAILVYGGKERNANLIGIIPELEEKAGNLRDYVKGDALKKLSTHRNSIILGINLAEKLGIKRLGVKVNLISRSGEVYTLKVVGFLKTGIGMIDNVRAYLHLKKLKTILGNPEGVDEIILKVREPDEAQKLAKKLRIEIPYEVKSWKESFKNLLSVMRVERIIMGAVNLSIILVAGFGIFNIVLMLVLQKRKEIAILMAMGFERKDIVLIFTLQGFIIGILGVFFGNLLGFYTLEYLEGIRLGTKVGDFFRIEFLPLDRSIYHHLVSTLFALIISVISSAYPSYSASKTQPVEIFRYG